MTIDSYQDRRIPIWRLNSEFKWLEEIAEAGGYRSRRNPKKLFDVVLKRPRLEIHFSMDRRIFLSDRHTSKLKKIFKKYWTEESINNLIKIFMDYGPDRFFGWCIEGKFLDKILGSRSKLFYEEIYNFIKTNFEEQLNKMLPESWSTDKKVDSGVDDILYNVYRRVISWWYVSKGTFRKEDFIEIFRCSVCGRDFNPYLVPWWVTKRFSRYIKICEYCYLEAFNKIGLEHDLDSKKGDKEMIDDLKRLVDLLGFIPSTHYGRIRDFVDTIPRDVETQVIKLMKNMASFKEYKRRFGSFFKALVAAGVLEDGARKETYGTRCIAIDGHECRSLAEQYIDNWLFRNGIPHEREAKYPGRYGFRVDWKVGRYFIEYYGLKGMKDYDAKIEIKRKICLENNIPLIEITPHDLTNLDSKLGHLRKIYGREWQ